MIGLFTRLGEYLWGRRRTPRLICMRLDEMVVVHPDQITGLCEKCGAEVGIYPSGQKMIALFDAIEIICHRCCGPVSGYLAPGAEAEVSSSLRVDRSS